MTSEPSDVNRHDGSLEASMVSQSMSKSCTITVPTAIRTACEWSLTVPATAAFPLKCNGLYSLTQAHMPVLLAVILDAVTQTAEMAVNVVWHVASNIYGWKWKWAINGMELGGWCYKRWKYLINIFRSLWNALKYDATGLLEICVRFCGSKLFPATLYIVCLLLRHAWMVQHKWTGKICHFKRHRQAM